MKKALLAALVSAGFAAGNAGAAVIDFSFAGSNAGSTASQFSFSNGGLTLTASAGRYSRQGNVYDETADPYPNLGRWAGGLGVYTASNDEHTVENDGRGFDYVKFVFDQSVRVLSVTVSYIGSGMFPDADAAYVYGAAANGSWTGLSYPETWFWATPDTFTFTLTDPTEDSIFRFGAPLGSSNDDSFKILGMQVSLADPQDPPPQEDPPTPAQVPVPATLGLLGIGALAFGARRRPLHPAN